MGRAIGIDLGTTNSCAAMIDSGKPRMITYKGGSTTIPSVFAIDESGRELVGQDAKKQAQLNPTQTVMASKRLIGRNFHSKVIDKVRQIFTYELVEGDEDQVLIRIRDQVYTLEQISAAILRKIKEVAEEALGEEVDQAVITVPAYFNDRQRQAVRTAGGMASLKVLRILNEPTAAALAYGLGRNLNQRIAVYDLGGGTFDVSVIDIKDRIFEVIATGGDTFLGGVDFDDRIMQKLLEDFHREHGIDLSWDRVAVQRIRDAAETAKIELSTLSATRIHIPFIARGDDGPLDIDVEFERKSLNGLTDDLVERTAETCARIFKEASSSKDQIDEMILVGGQSRMPLVQERIARFMGKPLSKGVNPDEAVAIGAAIMAHSLAGRDASDVTLLDVLPMPIGINKVDGTMHVLFPKNQPLPDYKTRTLTTSKDYQKSIMLRIYQGESKLVAENELLGTFVFSGIRQAPRGKVQIEVTFHIDSEGILNLTARDKATGQTVESTLRLGKKDRPKDRKRRPDKKKQASKASKASKPAEAAPASAEASPTAEETPKAAPKPLTMPTSGLASSIGGPNDGADTKEKGSTDAPVEPAEEPAEDEGPTKISRPDEISEERPTEEVSEADNGDASKDEDDEPETALAPPKGNPGMWKKISTFFKGLFGA